MNRNNKFWSVCIDTGGTFTDCIAVTPAGEKKRVKVLSSSALRGKITEQKSGNLFKVEAEWDAPDNFINGFSFSLLQYPENKGKVRRFSATDSIIELEKPLDRKNNAEGLSFEVTSEEEAPILAARLAAGIPAGKNLPPVNLRLATTKGTNALLENKGAPTALFVTKGFGDLLLIGSQQRPDLFSLKVEKPPHLYSDVVEADERLSAAGEVLKELKSNEADQKIEQLLNSGVRSAAIAFMHSYKNGVHEKRLKKQLLKKGFNHVSTSSELSPFVRIIPRAETTLVNAYLAPIIQEYLKSVKEKISEGKIFVMTSAGGLTPDQAFNPKDSLLSGPAGGVVGAATEGKNVGFDQVISFDMGGTSTDVARFYKDYEYTFEHKIGDAHLVAPSLYVETVAAGGGSVCYYDGYKLCIGPESAGAYPGPACYGAGGPLTITDVNLLMGRLDQTNFHIPVSADDSEKELQVILEKLNASSGDKVKRNSVLQSFLDIANERMADAIQKISIRKGYDTKEYALVAFGGAGGQHACTIAKRLNIEKIIVPNEAGLLSANGLQNAVIEEFAERQVLKPLSDMSESIESITDELAAEAYDKLLVTAKSDEIEIRRILLSMRLKGQETSLDIEYQPDQKAEELFKAMYKRQYGHWITGREIELESVRVVASTKTEKERPPAKYRRQSKPGPVITKHSWFYGNELETPVYERGKLKAGDFMEGPAIILDPYSTIVIEPGWRGTVCDNHSLLLENKDEAGNHRAGREPEAASLELFTNRFSSIATEMGEMLQRTAISVNVKDRLDFSCALLSPEGELVVNAPHIPVHLGALGLCVRSLKETISMERGDVVITNHPAYGGSHLPDVTIVTPVFTDDEKLIGYAASRAHHAEIGGINPGSMPPDATNLAEEGVVIPPMHLIKKGSEKWDEIRSELENADYPTRNADENIADLQAAVAANHQGARGLQSMVEKYGLDEVHHYMQALKDHAGSKMKARLGQIPNGSYESEEQLDDGTPLRVRYEINEEQITIDFTGTGSVHPNNLNATPAIVNSVIMYVLRLLVDEPLPLNEGLLSPVKIVLPTCLLNPEFHTDAAQCPAVVGGNTEVSQRLVDALLKPFELMACSQGTMNNVLFGNERFGYYETVGGGTGAGPDFHGADAVHHHMTNTRGTDPEVLEFRYPVRLNRYEVRKSSGGRGKFNGGNGIERELMFLEPVRLTVLTQHRAEKPYGLKGGRPGKRGEQWVFYKNGKKEKLKSSDGRDLEKGDRFILKTPDGGGYGTID
jgi:5-oxoprolinase (ATP-hydrolysing)